MNNEQNLVVGIFVGMVVMACAFILFSWGAKTERTANQKFDSCLTIAVKAIPDPNDTDGRNAFMKNCYQDGTNKNN